MVMIGSREEINAAWCWRCAGSWEEAVLTQGLMLVVSSPVCWAQLDNGGSRGTLVMEAVAL